MVCFAFYMSPLASASAFCVLALNVQAIGLNIVHAQHGYRFLLRPRRWRGRLEKFNLGIL